MNRCLLHRGKKFALYWNPPSSNLTPGTSANFLLVSRWTWGNNPFSFGNAKLRCPSGAEATIARRTLPGEREALQTGPFNPACSPLARWAGEVLFPFHA